MLFFLLPLISIGPLSGCKPKSTLETLSGPVASIQSAPDPVAQNDIAPDDPIWDVIAKRQAHLNRVEQNRTGHNDARSCQKAIPGPNHRVKIDASACTPDQLHAEYDAERSQLMDRASQMMRDRKQ
jgi:hypothetical protein